MMMSMYAVLEAPRGRAASFAAASKLGAGKTPILY
jgi:hypothetical protein